MRTRRKPATRQPRMQAGADGQAAGPAADVELDELPAAWLHALVHSLCAADKLRLFQASKHLSVVVLQQAGHVQLTLGASSGTSQQQQVEKWQHTMQPILAAAPATTLQVVLKRGLPAAYASLPHDRITHLTLHGFKGGADHLRHQLRLASCNRLHTLTLGEYCSRGAGSSTAAQLQQQAARLPPSLRSPQVFRSFSDDAAAAVARDVLQLLHPQLTSLKFIGNEDQPSCSMDRMPLPSLPQLTHFSTTGQLADCNIAQLLAAPALTHVEAGGMYPFPAADHSKKACSWQQLRLTYARCSLLGLNCLPLAGIPQVIIHGIHPGLSTLALPGQHQFVSASLSACAGLQCEGAWHPQLQQPVFSMDSICTPELISLCASKLVTPETCLQLTNTQHLEGLPAIIRQLPPTITALWYNDTGLWDGGELPVYLSLVPELSAHITLLVVCEDNDMGAAVDQLVAALDASGRDHVAVGVALCPWEHLWTAAEQQQWRAKYGDRVRLLRPARR